MREIIQQANKAIPGFSLNSKPSWKEKTESKRVVINKKSIRALPQIPEEDEQYIRDKDSKFTNAQTLFARKFEGKYSLSQLAGFRKQIKMVEHLFKKHSDIRQVIRDKFRIIVKETQKSDRFNKLYKALKSENLHIDTETNEVRLTKASLMAYMLYMYPQHLPEFSQPPSS